MLSRVKKTWFFSVVIAVLFCLPVPSSRFYAAWSQVRLSRMPVGPSIASIQDGKGNPLNAITLRKGDPATTIVIKGKNLKTAASAQLYKNQGVGQNDVGVSIVESLAEKLTLSLQMKTEKVTGTDFHIVLLDANGARVAEAKNLPIELKTAVKIQAAVPAQKTVAVQKQPVQPAAQKPVSPPNTQPATGTGTSKTQPVQPAASKTPASVTPAKPAVPPKSQVAPVASTAKTGPMRWSPISQRRRTEGGIKPPFLSGAQDPKTAVKNVIFKPAIEINKRTALTFKSFEILDPSKKKPKPVRPDTTFNLPNGESIKAKEYYAELNRLEKEFNSLGYSLDVRRQPDTTYAFARVAKSTTGFKARTGLTIQSLKQVQDSNTIQRKVSEKLLNSKKALLVPMKTSPGQKPSGAGSASGQMQRPQTALAPKEIQGQKETSAPQPNPYSKTISADFLEFGDKDLFAASLEGHMEIKAVPDRSEVINTAELWGYILGEGFKIAGVGATTRASYRNGMLQFMFVGSIMNKTVTEMALDMAKNVPDQKPEEMSPLPEITSGWKSFQPVDFEPPSFSTFFMAGPIPISVGVGASIAAGINYSLAATPVLNINHFAPWVRSDAYCQGGINLVITGAGVRCNLTLMDSYLNMQGIVDRKKEWVTVNYMIMRGYVACAGNMELYFYIYVPAFALPPWDRKEFTTNLVDWKGWHDEKMIVMQEEHHKLFH